MNRSGTIATGDAQRESWAELFDRHSRTYFIAPAVTLILIFAIFPTFYSIVFALSRVTFHAGRPAVPLRRPAEFQKQFLGNEQIHFLGRIEHHEPDGLDVQPHRHRRRACGGFTAPSAATILARHDWPVDFRRCCDQHCASAGRHAALRQSMGHTSDHPVLRDVGCGLQFVIGTGLAFLCSQPISGKNFFRVIFFIPLMITPLGVGYAFKMILDITEGPSSPSGTGLDCTTGPGRRMPGRRAPSSWSPTSWQWIPFIFIMHAGGPRKRAARPCRGGPGGRRIERRRSSAKSSGRRSCPSPQR